MSQVKVLTIPWSSVNSFLRQIAAVFGLVVSVANTFSMPTSLRDVIASVGGAILAAEHYANANNPATPPNSTITTPGA